MWSLFHQADNWPHISEWVCSCIAYLQLCWPFVKTPYNVAIVLDEIMEMTPNPCFINTLTHLCSNIAVGLLDYKKWWYYSDFLRPAQDDTNEMHRHLKPV